MRKSIGLAVSAALCLLAGTVEAQAQTYYFGVRGGYNHPHEADVLSGGARADAEIDPSGAAAAALGFEWVDGWRLEGELSWRRNDFDSVGDVTVEDGRAEIYAAMVNMYYGLRKDSAVNPYLGGGLGAAWLSVDDLEFGGTQVDDSAVRFAWQAMAGVDFALSDTWVLSAEYRYFSVNQVKMSNSMQAPFKVEYDSSAAMLGIRVRF